MSHMIQRVASQVLSEGSNPQPEKRSASQLKKSSMAVPSGPESCGNGGSARASSTALCTRSLGTCCTLTVPPFLTISTECAQPIEPHQEIESIPAHAKIQVVDRLRSGGERGADAG